MNDNAAHPALLPAGLRDVLPPEAEVEARSVEALMDIFAAHGFQRVKTPLLEFEDSLFAGSGAATSDQTFRLMDPESQRMLGFRADTTPQIGRLAVTRLAQAPRPLRLAYAGQCLRVRGSQLQPERQIAQAGIELIGHDAAAADVEVLLTAVAALHAVGLEKLSVDLTVPRLALNLLDDLPPDQKSALARALDRKDAAMVAALGGAHKTLFLQLLEATGIAADKIAALLAINLPAGAKAHAVRMAEIVAAIGAANPALVVTIDPVEFRGYQYHTGVCMTLFDAAGGAELGRGGRYLCGDTGPASGEPATGITLYPDTIVRAAPAPELRARLYVPSGAPAADAQAARARNFATVAGLAPVADIAAEAARLNCTHWLENGQAIELGAK
jgi:ATP phosphoribosyltransferase regulatory subunit